MFNLLIRNFPNILTSCNLIMGCVAISQAFSGRYDLAFLFIVFGAVFDFLDGMAARLLRVSSPIGKELDSLADCVTFGVAPSVMLFLTLKRFPWPEWLGDEGGVLPFVAFVMAAFSAFRLAKFNLDERQTSSFIGLATPANTLFWAGGMVSLPECVFGNALVGILLIVMMLLCSFLLVSEVPMFALKFKSWGWAGNKLRYVFLGLAALLIVFFGIVGVPLAIILYVLLSVFFYKGDR